MNSHGTPEGISERVLTVGVCWFLAIIENTLNKTSGDEGPFVVVDDPLPSITA